MTLSAALRAFEGDIPPFILRGARFTAHNPDCVVEISAQTEPEQPQEAQSPSEGAERAAALAELDALSAQRAEVEAANGRLAQELADAKEGRGTGGLALAVALRRLRQAHHVSLETKPLPLGPLCEASSLKVKGYAATADIDCERHRFDPKCWGQLDPSKVRLLLKHDSDTVAGTVDELELDALGRLAVTCTVTHPLAMRMPAFSVAGSVLKFSIRNPDRADFFGEVEEFALNEVSLTEIPGNSRALVAERWVPSAVELSNEAIIAKLKDLQATVAAMRAKDVFAVAA